MFSLILYVLGTTILVLAGASIVTLILGKKSVALSMALGLPMGALLNVLIVFALTIAGIPLSAFSIYLPLILTTIVAGFFAVRSLKETSPAVQESRGRTSPIHRVLSTACVFILGSLLIYSFAHAVMLPTFQYDSATNWTMRSKISFIDRHMAFDPTEDRGMAKPQYPFLFHALQITVNETQQEWSDMGASAILWLLSLSTFSALFIVVRRRQSSLHTLLILTGILGIPLFSLHLGQGYGDNVLGQYFLLSLLFLHEAIEEKSLQINLRLLILSSIFVVASVWTKSEGTFFGLIPWVLIVIVAFGRQRDRRKNVMISIITAIALGIPWHIFALTKGLLLTPHCSDTSFAFHPEALSEVMHGLFDRGSFGIAWYAIIILGAVILSELRKKNSRINVTSFPGILWGCIVFLGFLIVYLATPNVRFLLNAESFYRQMMIPAAMLMMSLGMAVHHHTIKSSLNGSGMLPAFDEKS